MIVTTLGTSHGDHTHSRFNSSTLIETAGQSVLVDAGAPVNALLKRAGKDLAALRAVFITHMHDDHVGGLPGLIKTYLKHGPRDGNVEVFLPEPEAIDGLSAWLKAQHLPWPSSQISLRNIAGQTVWSDGEMSVSAVRTRHLANPEGTFVSFSYVLEADGKRVLCTGDLSPDFSDFPVAACQRNLDLCVCESTHFDVPAALERLKTLPIKRLVLNHVADRWHGEGEAGLKNLLAAMPYPCHMAEDGSEFHVDQRRR